MKKVLLIIMILVIVGCTQSKGPSASITKEDVHKGNLGLVMNFGENMPPLKVYEGDVFPIGIELMNKGAFDITEGYLLLNLEEDNLQLEKGSIKDDIEIKGKSIGNPKGDFGIISFLAKSNKIGKETETITSNIIATACYKYRTSFSKDVCVDTDFYNLKKGEKACSAEDMVFSSGQGAPVSVVKVEPNMLEDDGVIKPRFVIYIENIGRGNVINPNSVEKVCSAEKIDYEDIN